MCHRKRIHISVPCFIKIYLPEIYFTEASATSGINVFNKRCFYKWHGCLNMMFCKGLIFYVNTLEGAIQGLYKGYNQRLTPIKKKKKHN